MSPYAAGRRLHVAVQLVLIAAGLLFYLPVLDNGFWHGEDLHMLDEARQIAEDPSGLLHLDVGERYHPVTLAVFALESKLFHLEPRGYYLLNLIVHGINAGLVYWLVLAFLPDWRIATLSGALFVFGVGSYGKAVMFAAGMENLFITLLYLAILNLYIRNDRYHAGRILSWRYLCVFLLFLITSYAKPTAFSLIAGLVAYKTFFRGERSGRRILTPNLYILVLAALGFWMLRESTGVVDYSHALAGRNVWQFAQNYVGNLVNYLIHMFFPIHMSQLVESGNPAVRFIYGMAPVLRVVIGLFAVSYSAFGFVFGNRTIRFFLAWTFISLLPYCVIQFPADWLNIRYLYQVAIGFCFIMSAGTVLSMDLLHRRRWRRYVPYLVPLGFVFLSAFITRGLDHKYEKEAQQPAVLETLELLRSGSGNPRS